MNFKDHLVLVMRLNPLGFKWHLSLLYVKIATVLVFKETVTDRNKDM